MRREETLGDLAARGARRRVQPAPMEATVTSPPMDADGFLRVVVDSQPGVVRVCPWIPRFDRDPQAGDAALVVESDAGDVWVVAWWPQTPLPEGSG